MIVPRGVAKLLARKGFADVVEIDEGDEIRLGDVVVRATHADHDADRGPFGTRAAVARLSRLRDAARLLRGRHRRLRRHGAARRRPGRRVAPGRGVGPDRSRRAHGRGARAPRHYVSCSRGSRSRSTGERWRRSTAAPRTTRTRGRDSPPSPGWPHPRSTYACWVSARRCPSRTEAPVHAPAAAGLRCRRANDTRRPDPETAR